MEISKIQLTVKWEDGVLMEKTFGILPPEPIDEPIMDMDIFYWLTVKEYFALTNKNNNFRISDRWEIVK